MIVTKHNDLPLVEVYEDFLTAEECDAFLNQPFNFARSTGWNDQADVNEVHRDRTSQTAWDSNLTKDLRHRVAQQFGVDPDTIENLQVQRYSPGQFYHAHHDYFHDGKNLENNRVMTFVIYLNDDFDGGFTEFPLLRTGFKPRRGSGIFFKYDYDDQHLNHLTLHAGTPVIKGVKNIVTAWFRKNKIA